MPPDVSRRRFNLLAGSLAAAQFPLHAAPVLTAADIVQHIHDSLGGDQPATSLDGFRAGDPTTPIRGIATTSMATLEVLRQAAKSRCNLIITYEPTFYGKADGPLPPPANPPPGGRGRGPLGVSPDDPVYTAKKDFIAKNNLVVYRLRNLWQTRRENDLVTALAESLGWTKYRLSPGDTLYDIPPASLEDTVAAIRRKLNLRGGLRATGDRRARVRRVMLHPGLMPVNVMWKRFTEVDLLLAGEVREWECTHYAFDVNTSGQKHALVTIGKVVSEDPGMRACAAWLKTVLEGVPVQWIPSPDPYWRPV